MEKVRVVLTVNGEEMEGEAEFIVNEGEANDSIFFVGTTDMLFVSDEGRTLLFKSVTPLRIALPGSEQLETVPVSVERKNEDPFITAMAHTIRRDPRMDPRSPDYIHPRDYFFGPLPLPTLPSKGVFKLTPELCQGCTEEPFERKTMSDVDQNGTVPDSIQQLLALADEIDLGGPAAGRLRVIAGAQEVERRTLEAELQVLKDVLAGTETKHTTFCLELESVEHGRDALKVRLQQYEAIRVAARAYVVDAWKLNEEMVSPYVMGDLAAKVVAALLPLEES